MNEYENLPLFTFLFYFNFFILPVGAGSYTVCSKPWWYRHMFDRSLLALADCAQLCIHKASAALAQSEMVLSFTSRLLEHTHSAYRSCDIWLTQAETLWELFLTSWCQNQSSEKDQPVNKKIQLTKESFCWTTWQSIKMILWSISNAIKYDVIINKRKT